MNGKLIHQRSTKPVRIDAGLHKLLKVKAAESGITLRELLESYLTDLLTPTVQVPR